MIKRMQIPRQLYNEGGISSVPLRRENFGLGSKFKKFVRKIIPKEVAQVAVKAAPFVAPFNPAIAGAMSGLGTFQQTGRMGKSLTAGGLNYAGGQAARYLGGAGFQGNPFAGGTGAFTPSGFMGGFSSPLGTETGLGKFLQDRRIARQPGNQFANARQAMTSNQAYSPQAPMGNQFANARQAMTSDLAYSPPTPLVDAADAGTYFPRSVENVAAMENANIRPYQDRIMRTASGVEPRPDLKMIEETIAGKPYQDRIMNKELMDITKGAAETSQEGLGSRIVEKVKTLNPLSGEFDFAKAGETIKDLGGKALNAVFRDSEGNLDKAAIMAALVTVPTFFEARALANEAGLSEGEFTEEMFTAAKADSKKTYESNLGSFFEGTGYTGNLAKGGRVGFKKGTPNPYAMVGETGETVLDFYYGGDMEAFLEANKPSKAKGGLMRRNYAFGPDPDEFPEDDDLTIFEIIKEQGIPVGEQVRNKKIDAGAKPIRMEVADLSANDIKLINYGKKHGLTTPMEIKEILGESFNKEKPPTNEEIKGVLEGTVTRPTGIFAAKGGRIGFDSGGNEEGALGFIHRDKIHKAYAMAEKSAEAEDINIDDEIYSDNKAHDLTNFFKNKRIRKALIEEGHDPDKIMRELLVEQMKSETGHGDPLSSEGFSGGITLSTGEELPGYSELFRKGGRVKYALGTPPAGEGGLGGLPVEADMRYTGGFMPYGEKEKADDVPARLSKNEFVFTADAVRAAGGGSMQKGAQRMYNTMKMLEGQVR